MKVIRTKLEGGATFPKKYRYNETTDTVEWTPDDGSTWYEDETADPRSSPALIQPLPAGARCDTATNMQMFLRSQVDGVIGILTDFGTAAGAVGAIVSFFLTAFQLLGPFGIIITLFFALATYLVEVGGVALSVAFDGAVWEQIRCAIYCNITEDGIVTDAIMSDIQTQINNDVVTTAAEVTIAMLAIMGTTGLTNAGKHGAGGSGCVDCPCSDEWCYTFDFTASDGGWTKALGTCCGTWVSGRGWTEQSASIYIQKTFTSSLVTKVTAVINVSGQTQNNGTNVGLYRGNPSSPTIIGGSEQHMPDGRNTYVWDAINLTLTNLLINPNDALNYADLEHLTIWGTGANPFGTSNCG